MDPAAGLRLSSAPGNHSFPRLMGDGLGGAYALWSDSDLGSREFLTRITETGQFDSRWPLNGMLIAPPGYVGTANIEPADRGGLLVVWSAGYVLRAQIFDRDGSRRWVAEGVPLRTGLYARGFNSRVRPEQDQIAPLGDSAWVIAWDDYRDQGYQDLKLDVYATWVSVSGVVGGPDGGLAICRAPMYQRDPVVVADGEGGVFIAWDDLRASSRVSPPDDQDVYVQRLSASGQVLWGVDGRPVATGPRFQKEPVMLADGAGGVFIAWADDEQYEGAAPSFVVLQHLLGDGSVDPAWPAGGKRVTSQANPNEGSQMLLPDGGGGGIVIWADARPGGNWAQRFDAAGNFLWAADGMSFGRKMGAYRAVSDSAGGVIVAGHVGVPGGGHLNVYAQRLDASGQRLWGDQGVAVSLAYHDQAYVSLVADGGMGAIVGWNDYRRSRDIFVQDSIDAYAQNVQADGTLGGVVTAAGPGLVTAAATAGEVVLEWYAGGASVVEIERRTSASAWARMASVFPDGAGRVSYEDRAVTPGERYGYRMRLRTAAGEVTAGETWIEVPQRLELALDGFVPNPMAGSGAVSFVTATGAPATLELFSPDGRRVERRELTGLIAGRHVVALEATLAPGVYLIRLEQAGERRHAKGIVIR